MLTLYHYWSSVCSQKARICLAEKRLEWRSRHVDLFTFENWEPAYVALNPKGVVPTLDHDGRIVIESNLILEYLEEAFPAAPRFRPDDPYGRARMRLWVYDSEEIAHPNVNTLSYNARHRLRLAGTPRAELERAAARCPNPVTGRRFLRRLDQGVSEREEGDAYATLDHLLDRMKRPLPRVPG
jgi:glutathione S-transferase